MIINVEGYVKNFDSQVNSNKNEDSVHNQNKVLEKFSGKGIEMDRCLNLLYTSLLQQLNFVWLVARNDKLPTKECLI